MSLPYRLGGKSVFVRPNEESITPKRVVFLSVEGTKTEVNYFHFVESYKKQLGIEAVVRIEVLRKHDTKSDPENVLDLLEEYVEFRTCKKFENELKTLDLEGYTIDFIQSYIDDPSNLSKRERRKFEEVLKSERIDLLYLDFLSKYHGTDDKFGIVIDRDYKSHTDTQMNNVRKKCKMKGYQCFITNPCIEFWLLLHLSDVKVEFAEQLDEIHRNDLDSQGNTFVSNLLYEKTGQRKGIQKASFEKYYLPNIDAAIDRAKDFASDDELLEKIGSNLGSLFEILRYS